MYIEETEPVVDNPDNLYKIIEDVVRGAGGHIENIFFGRDRLTLSKRIPIVAATLDFIIPTSGGPMLLFDF